MGMTAQGIAALAREAMRPLQGEGAWLEEHNEGAVPIRRFLYSLCRGANVDVAVELGVARGFTTLHLAAGVSQAVVGVDIAPDWAFVRDNQKVWDSHWPGKVRLLNADSVAQETAHEVEAILTELDADIGLLFIDSLHRAAHASREWELYGKLLAPGAIVAMDDIVDPPEMQVVYRAIPGEHIDLNWLHEVYRVGEVPQTVGFGIIITE